MNTLYKIIPFDIKHGNCGGSLVQFQQGEDAENALPFSIGKVLVSSDMQPGDVRGNHAHHETEEIVVALSGGCTFELDDGKGTRERVRLAACGCKGVVECGSKDAAALAPIRPNPETPIPNHSDTQPALLLYPHVWRTFYDFEPGTVLLVVANITYDEKDYIRDRAEFERIAKTWAGLGGSASP
ncbi:TDP-4-oxo-6-deoxy-alpha-D-glucose-3,4-oxoisomerase [Pontiella desulfatans]|uniref:TDP-4-oxo-6-deoxy-alpha-D-glucose-3,4-oxoisomeras e n=1 Tax=Pontiella desulfatans TaxID=2750659 RepID=A0A6C2TXU7_PONDE|nr:FdtA/QdtA family cupin domain-containing protein [Pontiella desulfatans]VGO12161.1 TDP-4-oxo-6-deoxy-alpha-D-glucose-3,4-oxoisomerase [Pontiella desulfatans]